MDMIGDISLLVADVTAAFGRYLRYHVKVQATATPSQAPNAFEIMMAAQRTLSASASQVRHPPLMVVKNKRDQLFNDLLSTIQSRDLQWRPEEVHCGSATKTIQAIRDTLWYIDGSHVTLSERSCEVPEIFKKFNGYNKPELSKHRKRVINSMARDVLISYSQSMFRVLQQAFWNRPEWVEFKSAVQQLAQSLASYADHLIDKRIRMQAVHSAEEVVRSIGDSLSVRFTGVRHSPPPYTAPISEAVMAAGPETPVELDELLPSDRRRKYDWLMEVRNGLGVPLVHVTYSLGGNLTWIWRSTATDINSALQTSQPIIEELKRSIP